MQDATNPDARFLFRTVEPLLRAKTGRQAVTTVLDALRCARVNLNPGSLAYLIGLDQLTNAITALENGKAPNDDIQEYLFGPLDLGKKSEPSGRAGEGTP
jgi:hypothetical protein